MLRALWMVGLAVGCTKVAPPEPSAPTSPATRPTDAPVADAIVVDAAPVIEEAEGEGTCRRDADCELTHWQEGCTCVGTCLAYAISEHELAAHIKQAACPKVRKEKCPPAAPCPKPKYRVLSAKCSKGTCVSVREVLPPPIDYDR